jgi:preprotein translocase subunit SecE
MNGLLQKTKDVFKGFIEFVSDTRKELKNVSWPSRHELVSTTVVVIVAVFFFGAFLAIVDVIVSGFMTFVLSKLAS